MLDAATSLSAWDIFKLKDTPAAEQVKAERNAVATGQ
jgi:hypothetical protein